MIDIFMNNPLPNALAVLVLIALVITWVTAIILNLRSEPVSTGTGWYPKLLPAFTILGLPAAWDLLHTPGIALLIVLIVLVVLVSNVVIPVLRMAGRTSHPLVNDWDRWSILASLIGGLAITIYLTFLRSPGSACGLSGGCDDVIDGRFGTLFGVLPVGTVGLFGYLAILLTWLVWQFGPLSIRRLAPIAMWGFSLFGVLFSIYLTALEPFVIGATCMWCICSAVLMMGLLLVTAPLAHQAHELVDEVDELE